jgi:hypothetical protein
MGIPLIAGRGIHESETVTAPRVAVVDETFVRPIWETSFRLGSDSILALVQSLTPNSNSKSSGWLRKRNSPTFMQSPFQRATCRMRSFRKR